FDRLNRSTVGPYGELTAGVHRLAVEEDGARPTLTAIAADLRSGKPQVIAQELGQRPAILDVDFMSGAVDGQRQARSRRRRSGSRRSGRGASPRLTFQCRRYRRGSSRAAGSLETSTARDL